MRLARTSFHARLAAVLAASGLLFSEVSAQEPSRLLDRLPAGAWGYARLDLARILREGPELRFPSMLRDPEVWPLIEPIWRFAEGSLGAYVDGLGIGLDAYGLDDLRIDVEAAFYAPMVDPHRARFAVRLGCEDVNRTLAAMESSLAAAIAGARIVGGAGGDVQILFVEGREMLAYRVEGKHLWIASNAPMLRSLLRNEEVESGRLTEESEFRSWDSACSTREGVFQLFFSYENLKAAGVYADASITPRELASFGLLDARAVAAHIDLVDGDISDSIALVLPERPIGLCAQLQALEGTDDLAAGLRSEAAAVVALHLDPSRWPELLGEDAWRTVLEFLQRSTGIQEAAAHELLEAMGPRFRVRVRPHDFMALPEIIATLELDDRAQFAETLAKLAAEVPVLSFDWTERKDLFVSSGRDETRGQLLQSVPVKESEKHSIEFGESSGVSFISLQPSELSKLYLFTPSAAIEGEDVVIADSAATLKRVLFERSTDEGSPRDVALDRRPPARPDTVLLLMVDLPDLVHRFLPFLNNMSQLLIFEGLGGDTTYLSASRVPRLAILEHGFSVFTLHVRRPQDVLVVEGRSAIGGLSTVTWAALFALTKQFFMGASRTLERAEELPADLPPELPGRHWIGAQVRSDEAQRILISEVVVDSPAAAAGLRVGDELVSANFERVRGAGALTRIVRTSRPGDPVLLKIRREGVVLDLAVEVASVGAEASER